jgi:hypothetical protein
MVTPESAWREPDLVAIRCPHGEEGWLASVCTGVAEPRRRFTHPSNEAPPVDLTHRGVSTHPHRSLQIEAVQMAMGVEAIRRPSDLSRSATSQITCFKSPISCRIAKESQGCRWSVVSPLASTIATTVMSVTR